jgi:pimeloyl-ACP methyl ester carboxylesterase
LDYYREQVQAFYDVLESTLKACNADESCFKDMGGDAVAAYDKLASAVSKQPWKFKFPLVSGKTQERALTLADLESAASGYLYSETPRMIFLRALAAANTHNDLIPMARVLYDSLYMDPETLQAVPDPTYSDAVYYGVECNDYYYPGESAQAAAEIYLRAGDEVDKNLPHFASLFYGDIPCPFWPLRTKNADRPAPLVADGIPTLVLGATADVATPVNQGKQVFSRLADGYLVTVQGGAHVVYGRGDACVDDIVTAFLVKDQPPAQRETVCQGVMYDPYVSNAATDAKVYANPLDALEAVDNEINYLPQYYDWDWKTPTSIGCSYGGVLSFEASDSGANFKLQNCTFSKGFILSGTGTYDNESQAFTLEVTVSGLAKGNLSYIHNADGSIRVTGDYAGKPVELKK